MECDECEYRLKCNVRRLKELKALRHNSDDDTINRERVRLLFEEKLNPMYKPTGREGNSHGYIGGQPK